MTHTILSIYRGYGTSEKQALALSKQKEARNLVAELRLVSAAFKGNSSYVRKLKHLRTLVSVEQYADWVGFYQL